MRMILVFIVYLLVFGFVQWNWWKQFSQWLNSKSSKQQTLLKSLLGAILIIANTAVVFRLFWIRAGGYDTTFAQSVIYFSGVFTAMNLTALLLLILQRVFVFIGHIFNKIRGLLVKFSSQNKRQPQTKTLAENRFDPERRRFLLFGGKTLAAASFGVPVIGALSTSRDYRVNRVPLYFANLPVGLEGLTIAQISDIHSGAFMTEHQIREIFEIVNSLHPNVIAMTGDFIDTSNGEIPAIHKTAGMLRSDYGIYGCLGNHDHFASINKVSAALRQKNVRMLNNAHESLMINDELVSIIGVDDAGRGFADYADLKTAMENIPSDSFKILLSHRPAFFPQAQQAGIDLTLSGHTHGGQVIGEHLGLEVNPIRYFHRYLEGLYIENEKQLYVNVGVGVAGIPIRLIPREITLLTLKRMIG